MTPVITRKLEFDAAHRVLHHESKCAHLHGHRYVVEVSCSAKELDLLGRVIDFSVIKKKLGGWIDEYWDHNIILNQNDPLFLHYLDVGKTHPIYAGKAPFPFEGNPTAENFASFFYFKANSLLVSDNIHVNAVRVYETPNCWADYRG